MSMFNATEQPKTPPAEGSWTEVAPRGKGVYHVWDKMSGKITVQDFAKLGAPSFALGTMFSGPIEMPAEPTAAKLTTLGELLSKVNSLDLAVPVVIAGRETEAVAVTVESLPDGKKRVVLSAGGK